MKARVVTTVGSYDDLPVPGEVGDLSAEQFAEKLSDALPKGLIALQLGGHLFFVSQLVSISFTR